MPERPNDEGDKTASQLISLPEAAERSGLSHSHLRLLAREEKIWAIKIGRQWVTTEKAVNEYLATERKPGPKPTGEGELETLD